VSEVDRTTNKEHDMANPEARLIVKVKEDRLSPATPLHLFETLFVYVDPEDGKIKNPTSYYPRAHPWEASIADLRVRAQADPTGEFYGFSAEYYDIYSLDLARAELCAKTLRRVEKHLEKLQGQFGYPQDLWAYLGRFASAFKVDTYGWQTAERAADYGPDSFRWGDIDAARYHVNEWRAKQVGVKA
jgi:hypothetical protein